MQKATDADLNYAGAQDLVYNGDPSKWLAAAYGLKARYLLHQSAVDNSVYASAEAAAQKAIDLGFAGMTITEFNGSSAYHPWTAYIKSRSYVASSSTVSKMMKANNDPRLPLYLNGGEAYNPGDAEAAKISASVAYPAWYKTGSQPLHLLSESEVYFILAETQLRQGKSATAAFQKGVTSSVTEIMTICGEDASVAADFAASLGEASLQKLFEQKYLAQSNDEQVETFNDMRRCEAMGENWIKLTNPMNTQSGLNRLPKRLPYGSDSVINNPKVAEAYGDGFYIYDQPVWWAGGSR